MYFSNRSDVNQFPPARCEESNFVPALFALWTLQLEQCSSSQEATDLRALCAPLPSRNVGARAVIGARSSRATKRGAMAAGSGAGRTAPRNMHGSQFRAILEAPERAADFLHCHLPVGIVAQLADEPPELVDGALLDEDLCNQQADRLFRVWLRSGKYIFVIVEHASKVDPEMASRLLHYRDPIWDREKTASDAKPGRRVPILALVLYHGKAPWTAPLSLPGMVSGNPAPHGARHGVRRPGAASRHMLGRLPAP